MIYTVGRIDVYEPYIASDRYAAKARGGTVWKFAFEASDYLLKHDLSNYKVYGIEADWEIDVEIDPKSEGKLYQLKRNAKLIKL